MILTESSMRGLFVGYNAIFNKAFAATPTVYKNLAMTVPSLTSENIYPWMNALPGIREWIGSRVLHALSLKGYTVRNRSFEETVRVPRVTVEDDQYGVYGPIFEKLAADAARHPDELVLSLLKAGFNTECYDDQYFFDVDHPVGGLNGISPVASVSNVQAGSGPAWFLLDCSQPIRPLIYQERRPYALTSKTRLEDDNVFFDDEFIYGLDGRSAAGFGLWQLAFGSRAPLNAANYDAARVAMKGFTSDAGKPLNVSPTHLVVPPSLERDARILLKAATGAAGASNPDFGTAELVATPHVIL